MYKLRPYQQETIELCGTSISKGIKGVLCVLPTGAGKTVIFASMANKASENGYTVLIITDSKKLFKQTSNYFDNPTIINAEANVNLDIQVGSIIVSMAQTLSRRSKTMDKLNNIPNLLVIVDEAHVKTSCKPLYKLDNSINIGFTATPCGDHLKDLFFELHDVITIPELIHEHYLTPCKSWSRRIVDTSNLKKAKGEYTEQSQTEAFRTGHYGLLDDLRTVNYKKALVFTSCIAQCDQVAEYLKANGIDVAVVHSEQDDIELFYQEHAVCVSVGMLTKGFDYPIIDLVIIFRKTTSTPLFLQMCGRGGRKAEGKEVWNIIDYGGNIEVHGLWDSVREWEIGAEKKKVKGDDGEDIITAIPLCECNCCGYVSLDKFEVCPECGSDVKKQEIVDVETDKKLWSSDKDPNKLTAQELFRYACEMKRRRLAIRIAMRRGQDYLTEYAKAAGYSPHWVGVVMNNYGYY